MSIVDDVKACKGNTKGKLFIIGFRASSFFVKNKFLRIIGLPIRIIFKVFTEYIYGIEIKDTTKIGTGFNIYHGYGTVISSKVIIGNYVSIRQGTTIASNGFDGVGQRPEIGDHVQIGAGCMILGGIKIGNNSVIGAGSVVIGDVPAYAVVVGNPARIIKYIDHD